MAEEYVAGTCNIGPAEIALRRRVGEGGAVATAGVLVTLAVTRAPRAWHLLAALPAAVSAAGYLQARRRFCAAFGWRGVFNFGKIGVVQQVEEAAARAADRRRAVRLALEAGGIGLAVALCSLVGGGRRH
jgi:hypothetical protein